MANFLLDFIVILYDTGKKTIIFMQKHNIYEKKKYIINSTGLNSLNTGTF